MKKDGDIASLFIQKICDKEDGFAFPGSGFEGRTNWTSMYAEVADDMGVNFEFRLVILQLAQDTYSLYPTCTFSNSRSMFNGTGYHCSKDGCTGITILIFRHILDSLITKSVISIRLNV